MSADLVKRLRDEAEEQRLCGEVIDGDVVGEAADRIAYLEASEHGLFGRLETCRQDEAALKARIEQLERELVEVTKAHKFEIDLRMTTSAELTAEKALSKDLDGCLQISEDIINAASKRLTKGKRAKWGLWYLETIAASRAAHRKARGL